MPPEAQEPARDGHGVPGGRRLLPEDGHQRGRSLLQADERGAISPAPVEAASACLSTTRAVVAHSTGPWARSTPPSARARSHSHAWLLAHAASPTAPTQIHIELGRFTSAAKVQKEIGELYEAEGDTAAALKAYEEAAEYYNAEESKSQANQILLKVASLAADASNYTRAIEIYEQVWRSPRKMALMILMAPCTRSSRSPPSSPT